jgi:hypothetical protein
MRNNQLYVSVIVLGVVVLIVGVLLLAKVFGEHHTLPHRLSSRSNLSHCRHRRHVGREVQKCSIASFYPAARSELYSANRII